MTNNIVTALTYRSIPCGTSPLASRWRRRACRRIRLSSSCIQTAQNLDDGVVSTNKKSESEYTAYKRGHIPQKLSSSPRPRSWRRAPRYRVDNACFALQIFRQHVLSTSAPIRFTLRSVRLRPHFRCHSGQACLRVGRFNWWHRCVRVRSYQRLSLVLGRFVWCWRCEGFGDEGCRCARRRIYTHCGGL